MHLHFGDRRLSLLADCNDMSARYKLEGDRVVAQDFLVTSMGCDPDGHAQDDWLVEFFRAGPRLHAGGDRLTFTHDAVRLVFLDREVADPDRPLQGTVWEIGEYIEGETAMGLLGIEPPRLTFAADNRWQASATCLRASGGYRIEGERITLSGTRVTISAECQDDNDREAATFVGSLLKDGELRFRIDARRLELSRGARRLGAGAASPQP